MNISIEWQGGRSHQIEPAETPGEFICDEDGDIGSHFVALPSHGCTPNDLAPSRTELWPDVNHACQSIHLLQIYQRVKTSGLPNMLQVREPVPSQLRTEAWLGIVTGHNQDEYVLGGVKFGFPLHYLGPPLTRPNRSLHASAEKFQRQVSEYLHIETRNRAMLGPFQASPFKQWTTFSPIMTREVRAPEATHHCRFVLPCWGQCECLFSEEHGLPPSAVWVQVCVCVCILF